MFLKRLFWAVFPPPELRNVLQLIRAHGADDDFSSYGGAGWDVVKPRARMWLAQNQDSVLAAIRDRGESPEKLVTLMMYDIAREELRSGRYHIYRSTLSGIGGGLHYVVGQLINEAVSLGICSEEEARDTRAQVRHEIQDVG